MNTSYRCWAEVDLDALRGNLAWIRHRVGPKVKILTVVKADAYGHGLKQIAALLMQSGTDIFGVANLAEASAIRRVGKGWPVLMLGALLPDEMETAVKDHVRATISSLDEATALSRVATRLQKIASVHVKVDTGMGRLGARPKDALELIRSTAQLPGLAIDGLYTHYASAEDDAAFSKAQAEGFEGVINAVTKAGIQIPLIHANNSAALLHQPETTFNLVRPGLLVYGILPEGQRADVAALRKFFHPALSWKCRVGFVKEIRKGDSLSYGRTFVAPRKMKVATLTAGYGDGYLRAGSNRAEVLIQGRRCKVLGRVTMDQTLVDVTKLDNVAAGEEAVLIGSQHGETISAAELAQWCGTIPWEILTAITYRVPRLYRGSQAS
ncbi:MAG: alanine racemase [Verrucomicrobia bacterium]|nr:alanine racemase [Verrucomicrobiota bacterium]